MNWILNLGCEVVHELWHSDFHPEVHEVSDHELLIHLELIVPGNMMNGSHTFFAEGS
jgi:hypothetical protein